MSALTVAVMARAMTEDELLTAVTEAATLYGWRWFHIRRSDRAQQMGHAGWPDLILSRGASMLALELKTEHGRLTVEQARWLGALGAAGIEYAVVRPRNLDAVLRWLR
jgi:VRR-NUC domain